MSNELKIDVIPEQNSLTSILDLRDDCLLQIFNQLEGIDLVAVHQTCKKFRQLSEYHYSLKYKHKPFLIHNKHIPEELEEYLEYHYNPKKKYQKVTNRTTNKQIPEELPVSQIKRTHILENSLVY